ncbi:MAG: NAD(P)H-quinone oxidoreductase subunit F [Coleofasciculaceae cyanobacterium RL_1_1]|nr:NAD(P)H-quinone oxidoreductase subunit F [Coleofasciculaceae cyanobacterium RL_1_1]
MAHLLSQNVWLIPCYALIGAMLALPWSPGLVRRTGPRPAGYINVVLSLLALVHSLVALTDIWGQSATSESFVWLDAAGLTITLDLEVSSLTLGVCSLIASLNLLAQTYAIAYLEMDWGWARFYSLMGLFEAGLCFLVLCNSLFFSYVILEILTLGTYLIVGFWYNQSLVVTGARDAFLTKRVGDLILLMGVVALLPIAGTWNFADLAQWAATAELEPRVATLLACALIAGPIAKCAQFPLHLWLDEAMEGPYPATILRNTLVVSTGAWVLIKIMPVVALSEFAVSAVIVTGAATAIGASAISIAQIDIKRVLSYLTSAYLGLVFIAIGSGASQTALMMLFVFVLSMALLVMATGNIVLNNITQNLTQMGGLWARRPVTGLCVAIGGLSLLALPPLGGFWALVPLADWLWQSEPALLAVVLATNALIGISVARLFGLMFGGVVTDWTRRSPEGLWLLVLPTTVLAGFALHVPLFFAAWEILPQMNTLAPSIGAIVTWSSLLGVAIGSLFYLAPTAKPPVTLVPQPLRDFLAYDFYTPQLYKLLLVSPIGQLSRFINWLDRYIVDGVVNLVGVAAVFGGESLKYNTSGRSQFYVLSIILSVAIFILIMSLPALRLLSAGL